MPTPLTREQAHALIAEAPGAVLEARAARARRRWTALWWTVPLTALAMAVLVAVLLPHLGDAATRPSAGTVVRYEAILVLPFAVASGVAAWLLAEASRAAAVARLPGWYGDDGALTTRAEALVDEADRLLRRYDVGPPALEPAEALAAAAREMLPTA